MLLKLEEYVDSDEIGLKDRAFGYFALWNFYNKLNNFKDAVTNLHKANNCMLNNLNLDDKDLTKKTMHREAEYFNDIKVKYNNIDKLSNSTLNTDFQPIFILGMPRSGTSLMEQIISAHSQVFGAGERGSLQMIVENNNYPEEISLYDTDKLNQLANNYYKSISEGSQDYINIITDKLPHNFLYIGLIKQLFSDAKIIHIQRDKLDNCLSIYSKLFSGELPWSYDWNDVQEYYDLYYDLMKYWNNKYDDIYNIKYEDLVNSPDKYIREILNYCSLDYEEDCINFTKNKRAVFTASALEVRKDFYTSSIKRWDQYKEFF